MTKVIQGHKIHVHELLQVTYAARLALSFPISDRTLVPGSCSLPSPFCLPL